MSDIQSVITMGVIVALLFVAAHFVRKISAPKVKTADDLERDQLAESLYNQAEYTALAEYYASQAAMYAKRAKRLQDKGVTLPPQRTKVFAGQMPPHRSPPSPPKPSDIFYNANTVRS